MARSADHLDLDSDVLTDVMTLDGRSLALSDVVHVARGAFPPRVRISAEAGERMDRSVTVRRELIERGSPVYGVTTGFGDSSSRQIAAAASSALQRNLLRFLRVGTGPEAPGEVVRAAMLIRANCLARGYSGIRAEPVRLLLDLIENDILPVIPERGSVGASGDLAPLSHLSAALTGEGEVVHAGARADAADALKACALEPVDLEAKEGLALVNGTSFMSAFAVLAAEDARRLAFAADLCTAFIVHVRRGRPEEFAPFPHEHKPHPGQIRSAAVIRQLLDGVRPVLPAAVPPPRDGGYRQLDQHLQEPYSVRCAPHVNGVLRDTLRWVEEWLTVEINSSNDNPLFDEAAETAHNSGNFYGGHVAHAMDSLKLAAAGIADLLDRQLQLIVDEKYNRGLPPNLVSPGAWSGREAGLHHGFKGMQIAASALAAEALHLTTPASAFSRSTEAHNQDKVSMGTIAARDARLAVQLATDTGAIHLRGLCLGGDLRGVEQLRPALRGVH